jgi:hypothetical protein
MEYHVVHPDFQHLFRPQEIREAKHRLKHLIDLL